MSSNTLQPDVLGAILAQSGIVLAASAIVLTLSKDVYERIERPVGFGPFAGAAVVPKYTSRSAVKLRAILPAIPWLLFILYLVVAVVVTIRALAPDIPVLGEITVKTFRTYFDALHFIVVLTMIWVLVLGTAMRQEESDQIT